MAEGIYSIEFIHPKTGETVEVLDSERWRSLNYVRELNGIGSYALTFDASDNLAQYANTLDLIAEIRRRDEGVSEWTVEDTFFTRFYDDFQDENDINLMIFGGFNLNHLLARRRVRPEDDPNGTPNSIKGDLADRVMREVVLEQLISPINPTRQSVPNLSAANVLGVGNFVFDELNNNIVLDVLQGWAVKGQVDFEIRRESGLNLVFYARVIGSKLTISVGLNQADFVLFDPIRGNMLQPRLSRDRRNEESVVYVMGQGPEEDRDVLRVVGNTWLDSPYNWIEGVTDNRAIEIGTFEGLQTSGLEYLREKQAVITFDFEPDLDADGGRYKHDWDLGDIVSASYKGNDFEFRIQQIDITVDDSGETINPTLAQQTNLI